MWLISPDGPALPLLSHLFIQFQLQFYLGQPLEMQHLVIEVVPHDSRHTLQLGMRRYRYQYRVLVTIPILVSGVTLMFVLQRHL